MFAYDTNESVYDPDLREHLAHFGLDITKFDKVIVMQTDYCLVCMYVSNENILD